MSCVRGVYLPVAGSGLATPTAAPGRGCWMTVSLSVRGTGRASTGVNDRILREMSMQTVRSSRRRYLTRAGACAIAGAALVACGSSANSSGGDTSPSTGSSAKNASCVAEATSLTNAGLASDTGNPYPTTPTNAAVVKGKTYWFVDLDASLPADAQSEQGFQAAATAAGAKVRFYDGQGSPATVIQGVNTAIAAKAAAIVLLNVDISTLKAELTAAKAAGIPVIETNNGSTAEPFLPGVTAHVTPNNATAGKLQADYALYATHCELNAIIISTLSVASDKAIVDGSEEEIARLCPGCKLTDVDVQAADIATKLPGLVESALQRNPDTNIIIDGSDTAYVPGIQVAQNSLRTNIPIVSNDGDSVPPSGLPIVADTVEGSRVSNGWFYFDAVIRAAHGQTGFTMEIPTVLVDKTNWGTGKPPFVPPAYNDYKGAFNKLWGLG